MELWIARHGPNHLGGETHLDRERALTPRGIKHVAAVASQMKRDAQMPKGILSSVFKRTMQTADIFGRALRSRVIPCDEIGPEVPIWPFVQKLVQYQNSGLMMVGHHTGFERMLAEHGDGGAPVVLACGEVRRYTIDSTDVNRMRLFYRVTPADVGMPDMITLKAILGV